MALNSKPTDCSVAIIGAGPYGLSAAAYLRAAGVEPNVFGKPMAFWDDQMPAGMRLRSNWGASHIADPKQELTLDAYCLQNGNHLSKPIPLERFVDYGRWYQRQAVPNLDNRQISSVKRDVRSFRLVMTDGAEFTARRVVVAAGIGAFCEPSWGVRRHSGRPGLAYNRSEGSSKIQRPAGSCHWRGPERFGVGGFA